jgi:HPt (histidine-containing phosphotransfer) domain-containing protein
MSDPTPATADLLDLVALNELKDMLAEALAEIAQSFLDGLSNDVASVAQGMPGDATAVRAAAHSLKGSAGNMGSKALAATASAIEKAALAGDMAQCQALMPQLQAVAEQTRVALQAYIDQP